MPILRSSSKRRSRVDLTAEMISAPLADFRHTMHIGRGGDTFGDTSFLSTKPAPANQMVPSKNGLLMRKFRGSKHSLSARNSTDGTSYMLQANSTISLPAVNDNNAATLHLPKSASSNFSEVSGLKEQRLETSNEEQRFEEHAEILSPPTGVMKQAESILSFHIDLGPSMLGDVLSVMDQNEFSQKEVDKQDTENDWKQDLDVSQPLSAFSAPSLRVNKEKTHNANGSTTHSATHTPRATFSATPCTTQSTKFSAPSGATQLSTQSTCSATRNTVFSAPTGATQSSTYNTAFSTTSSNSYRSTSSTAYNAIPSATQSTANITGINEEDILFMDEDEDDEIRV